MSPSKFLKEDRVRKRHEYVNFIHKKEPHKQTVRLGVCVIYKIPNEKNCPRVGITIKYKTTSVFRNRIKRMVREKFRKIKQHLGSFDFNVVIPGKLRTGKNEKINNQDFFKQIKKAVENYFDTYN